MRTTTSAGPEDETVAQGRIAGTAAAICRVVRERRPCRVVALVVLLWVLNLFDLAYTIHAHQTGHFLELNPLARDLLDWPWVLAGFKFLAVLAGSIILLYLRRHRLAELAAWLLCLAYVALALRWLDFCTALFGPH